MCELHNICILFKKCTFLETMTAVDKRKTGTWTSRSIIIYFYEYFEKSVKKEVFFEGKEREYKLSIITILLCCCFCRSTNASKNTCVCYKQTTQPNNVEKCQKLLLVCETYLVKICQYLINFLFILVL